MKSSSTCILSAYEQEKLIDKLNIFKIQGQDKRGNKLVHIIGNLFSARRLVNVEVLKKYMKERVFARLSDEEEEEEEVKPFSVVYMHTGVGWMQNFAGMMAARSIYDAIPVNIKKGLQVIYFIHADLQSRLFGRLLFTQDLYSKVNYMSRLQFLWKHVRRNEIDIPDFVSNHDKDLDSCGRRRLPFADYSLEICSPAKQVYGVAAYLESPISTFSMSPKWLDC